MQKLAGLFALALLVVPAAIATTAGEKADYKFNAPLDNGRGVTSMADFLGKPVLIDFWGTR